MNDLEKFATLQGHNNKLKVAGIKEKVSECALCKRVKIIVYNKCELCNACYQWCKTWVINKYGSYYKNKMNEAMNAYFQPIYCKGCGNEMVIRPGMTRLQFRKIPLCNRCKNIYYIMKRKQLNVSRKRSGRYPFKGN